MTSLNDDAAFEHEEYLVERERGMHLHPRRPSKPAISAAELRVIEARLHVHDEFDFEPMSYELGELLEQIRWATFGTAKYAELTVKIAAERERLAAHPYRTEAHDGRDL
jgi:hypothetical protein